MRSIIVDDESNSHDVLQRLLERHPDIQVVASGYNVEQGVELIKAQQPELVFLDVEMPDGTGFDLLNRLDNPNFLLIFITAHNGYAISAIRFGALDYILKPISAETLADALIRVRKKHEEIQMAEKIKQAFETFEQFRQQKLPTRMLVSTHEGNHYLPIDQIIRLKAATTSTEIFYSSAQKRLIAAKTLGVYEEQFAPYPNFMRVHRSHIVNLMMVDSYNKGDANLQMVDDSEVPVSKDYRDDLLKRLKEL